MFITPSFLLIALAVFIAIMLIPAMLFPKKFIAAMKEIHDSNAMIRMSGYGSMIFAFLFLSVHWKLNGGWFIVIPIIGWLAFLKGTVRLLAPNYVKGMMKKFYKSESTVTLMSFLGLLLAIGLTYVALYIY